MNGIVIHNLKIIYWFIPKCACTTMKMYFADILGLEYTDVHSADFEYTDRSINGYQEFAYVRDPFDRLMSLYKDKVLNYSEFVFGKYPNIKEGMSFNEFVDEITKIHYYDADNHFKPQHVQIPMHKAILIKMEGDKFLQSRPICNHTHNKGAGFSFESYLKVREYYSEDYIKLGYT